MQEDIFYFSFSIDNVDYLIIYYFLSIILLLRMWCLKIFRRYKHLGVILTMIKVACHKEKFFNYKNY